MSDAMSVKRFIINNDVDKSHRLLLKKCRGYLHRYFLRVTVILIVLLLLCAALSGYTPAHEDALIFVVFAMLTVLLCTLYLTDLNLTKIPIGILKTVLLYLKLLDTKYENVGQLFNINEADELLRGKRIMSVLQECTIHHVSLTHDGNLAFIATDVNGKDSLVAYKVDTSQLSENTDKVDIVVDVCYIKAQPHSKN